MKKVTSEVYNRINNDLYDVDSDKWWQPDSPFYLIRSSLNPVRVGYFKKILFSDLKMSTKGKYALEVGCGGGLLCEEIATIGFDTTGIDPSEQSLKTAEDHMKANSLNIHYIKGIGEAIPFLENSYDVVFCCDVLEHVCDAPKVISEIFRVLRPGGCFCYDTFNRTLLSKLIAIDISQKWKRWAFAPPDIHVWNMFIKPNELEELLRKTGFKRIGHKGMQPNISYLKALHLLRRRAKGEISYRELGEKMFMTESNNTNIMYLGYAVK